MASDMVEYHGGDEMLAAAVERVAPDRLTLRPESIVFAKGWRYWDDVQQVLSWTTQEVCVELDELFSVEYIRRPTGTQQAEMVEKAARALYESEWQAEAMPEWPEVPWFVNRDKYLVTARIVLSALGLVDGGGERE